MKRIFYLICCIIVVTFFGGCSQANDDTKDDEDTKSPFAGTWINEEYNGMNGQPSAKLVISNDGLSWTGYNTIADTVSIGSAVVINEGKYAVDDTWTKFKDSWFRLLKVSGSTLYFYLDSASYDAAYVTVTKNYHYTKQ